MRLTASSLGRNAPGAVASVDVPATLDNLGSAARCRTDVKECTADIFLACLFYRRKAAMEVGRQPSGPSGHRPADGAVVHLCDCPRETDLAKSDRLFVMPEGRRLQCNPGQQRQVVTQPYQQFPTALS